MSHPYNTTVSKNTNSAGSVFSDTRALDGHYEFAKREYDACIAHVGIQAGWHVLDAGCGSGIFLPHLAAMVGPTGRVAAIDHAEEAVAMVNAWAKHETVPALVEARVGKITELPYDDATFDCVWCANTTQYFDDDGLARLLSEFRRVVKPGGLIAIKETDSRYHTFSPIPPQVYVRYQAAGNSDKLSPLYRATYLPHYMRAHGLEVVHRETFLVDRVGPFKRAERQFLISGFRTIARDFAPKRPLSTEDLAFWKHIEESIEQLVDEPDTCVREVFIVVVGRTLRGNAGSTGPDVALLDRVRAGGFGDAPLPELPGAKPPPKKPGLKEFENDRLNRIYRLGEDAS